MDRITPNGEREVPTTFFFTGHSIITLKSGDELFGTDTGTIDLPPGRGGFASLITFTGPATTPVNRWLTSGFGLQIRFPGPHIDRNRNVRMCYEPHAVDLLQAIGDPNRVIRLLPVLRGARNMVNIVDVSNVSA